MPSARRRLVLGAVAVGFAFAAVPAAAIQPYPETPVGGNVYDWANTLFIGNGDCSSGAAGANDLYDKFHCANDWKYTDHRESSPQKAAFLTNNPQEFFGIKGTGVNRAWEISTGRPDVVIAVLDSGIRWEETGNAALSLVNKHFLNRGELPRPQNAGGQTLQNPIDPRFDGYDVNGDGVYNVRDYAADPRVSDLNGNGMDPDPEDLIRTFSDGSDADDNGYVDDISGWDFFENDNNPQDDVDYGHGTGEARDSTAEADVDADGQCPNCMHLPMRVGDSFIADVNHFAEAVIYAVDNGASVVQEALGTLNHSSYGQEAVDYAYRNGVIVNASEADESAGHHNWPAAYDHTMVVNSVKSPSLPTVTPPSFLYFNGCTNFGGYTYVAIPSASCSSEATGLSSGVSGLLYSAARNAIERDEMTPYLDDEGNPAGFPLSAEEAKQLWRLSADDIDFSSPCNDPALGAVPANFEHSFCNASPNYGTAVPLASPNNYAVAGLPVPTTRYQTVKGWDYFTGYGRSNAARLLRYIGNEVRTGAQEFLPTGPFGYGDDSAGAALTAQDRIPPEADLTSPKWWKQYPYQTNGQLLVPDDAGNPGQIVIEGRAAANRVTAEGGTFGYVLEWAPEVQGQGFPVGSTQTAPNSAEDSAGPWTQVSSATGLTAAFEGELGRINVSAIISAQQANPSPFQPGLDPTSEFNPEQNAVRVRLRVIADPLADGDTVNNEAVFQKQIDVYPAAETVLRDDLGQDGAYTGGSSSPAFHDLDGDGIDELVVGSDDGVIHAYTDVRLGTELDGWPVRTDPYSGVADRLEGDNAYTDPDSGVRDDVGGAVLAGDPVAADLDDDGSMELIVGDLEGKVYAWSQDGSLQDGFPVTVDYSLTREPACGPAAIPDCDDYAFQDLRDEFNARDFGINSAPAVGDLDPSTTGLEIVVGANDNHVYAWHADGTPVAGWPVVLRDPAKVATMDDSGFFTYVAGSQAVMGSKILVSPSLGDLTGDGDLEVVLGVNEEYTEAPNTSAFDDPAFSLLANTGLLDPGNTRIYALESTGTLTPASESVTATPHTDDQAYVPGWPVKIALLTTGLLPYVGEGSNGQAPLADLNNDGDLEVAIASAAGPAYLLNPNGTSFLGNGPDGRYRTLASTTFQSTAGDTPTYVGVGALAVGSRDGGGHISVAGPGAGLRRLLDIAFEERQADAEDHVQIWDSRNGRYDPGAPIVVNDLQFFTPPIVGDLTNDGRAEVVQGTAVNDTVVIGGGVGSTSENATRYHTGGWTVSAAAIGNPPLQTGDNGSQHLATTTREGYLRLYPSTVQVDSARGCGALTEWPEYGHDALNSGNYETDGERPGPLRDMTATVGDDGRATVTFTASGDDRFCGSATSYDVRRGTSWSLAAPVAVEADAPPAAGAEDSLVTEPLPDGFTTLLVRARDEAGNGSAVRQVTVRRGTEPPPPPPPPSPTSPDAPSPSPSGAPAPSPSPSDGEGPGDGSGPGETPGGPEPDRPDEVVRVAGTNRVATAVALSSEAFTSADQAILARADQFPDALAAGTLSAEIDGPVLLTGSGNLDAAVVGELDRLGVSQVYLAGGTAALSEQVERDVASEGIASVRLVGDDRFQTAAAIAREIVRLGGPVDQAIIVRADTFPDALAAGGVATTGRAPILLTGTNELPDVTLTALRDVMAGNQVIVAGGVAAVAVGPETELRAAGYQVRRLAGDDRYSTGAALVNEALTQGADPQPTILASGANFPDALAAVPAAFRLDGIVLLADPMDLTASPATVDFLTAQANAIDTVILAGGTEALSDRVRIQALDIVTD